MFFLRKNQYLLLFFLLFLLTLSACGGVKVEEGHSPSLLDATVESVSQGTEDTQQVRVTLVFDRAVCVDATRTDALRITVSGNRVREYDLSIGTGENEVLLTFSTTAVTTGELVIQKGESTDGIAAIVDSGGKFAAMNFTLEAMIPSGVTLSTVEQGSGYVVKSVDTTWAIRSIAWLGLMEDGELVYASSTGTLNMLSGYAAVHGHDFFWEDQADIAQRMVEVLQENFDDTYTFTWEDNRITVTARGDVELDLVLYSYCRIS